MRILSLLFVLAAPLPLAAKGDPLHVVGSSSVYNYASFVAEAASYDLGLPIIMEQVGTGAGILLFCNGGKDAPDLAMASRPITTNERELCIKNGRTAEATIIGRDALTLVASKKHPLNRLTLEQLYLALASSTHRNWHGIVPGIHAPISIYGPAVNSGTREVVKDKVFTPHCAGKAASCYQVREDGAFIELGENYNLLIQKLLLDENSVGLVPYGYYLPYQQELKAIEINGATPTEETIKSGLYPLTRDLYLYHLAEAEQNQATRQWLKYWHELPILVRKQINRLGLLSK